MEDDDDYSESDTEPQSKKFDRASLTSRSLSEEFSDSTSVCTADSVDPIVLPQALSELDRSVAMHGPNHEKVAEAWNSLGLIRLHMQKNAHEALKCHQKALDIYNLIEAPSVHLHMAITFNDLGMCYERLNDRENALLLYNRALLFAQSDAAVTEKVWLFRATERAIDRLSSK